MLEKGTSGREWKWGNKVSRHLAERKAPRELSLITRIFKHQSAHSTVGEKDPDMRNCFGFISCTKNAMQNAKLFQPGVSSSSINTELQLSNSRSALRFMADSRERRVCGRPTKRRSTSAQRPRYARSCVFLIRQCSMCCRNIFALENVSEKIDKRRKS